MHAETHSFIFTMILDFLNRAHRLFNLSKSTERRAGDNSQTLHSICSLSETNFTLREVVGVECAF